MAFKKATKSKSKLRLALYGPAGSGKTFTALRVATGIVGPTGRIACIDTERGTASKYADRFSFDVDELTQPTVEMLVAKMAEAAKEGYDALVIDSASHCWQELLQEVEKIAKAKYKGNTWSAWSEGTPKQRRLIDAMTSLPMHLIVTMRSKTEWATEGDGHKNKPVRVGLAPEQGKGIEYEFDLLMSLNVDHVAVVEKDRTGRYQDKVIEKPGEEFGAELREWLDDGVDAPATPAPETPAVSPFMAEMNKVRRQIERHLLPLYDGDADAAAEDFGQRWATLCDNSGFGYVAGSWADLELLVSDRSNRLRLYRSLQEMAAALAKEHPLPTPDQSVAGAASGLTRRPDRWR